MTLVSSAPERDLLHGGGAVTTLMRVHDRPESAGMPNVLRLLIVAATAALLSSCSGGGEAPPPRGAAALAGCPTADVADGGAIVYVIGDCPKVTYAGTTVLSGQEVDVEGVRVGLFKAGQWRAIDNAPWQQRDGAGLLVFKGELYLLGGWLLGPTTSEVWKTKDLVRWELVTIAPWAGRHGAGWLVHGDRMYVIGGDLLDDVWSSADGLHWTQEASGAPFGKRYTPNAASIDGWIVVYAGQYWEPVEWMPIGPRDVWRSRDGKQWERVGDAPWGGRGLIHGSVVHGGSVYLIGGGLKVPPPGARYNETLVEFSDIWTMTKDGVWSLSGTFDFPRTHLAVLESPHGCFVAGGSVGRQTNLTNDVLFAPDCLRFAKLPVPVEMQIRHAASFAYFNDSLVILGGPGEAGTTIWQYFVGRTGLSLAS
jgi:hypothetical protein